MSIKDAIRVNVEKGRRGLAILEFEPCCRNVFIGNQRYYLSFPYHYIIMQYFCAKFMGIRWAYGLDSIRIGLRKKPLQSVHDKLAEFPLPGGEGFACMCLGSYTNVPHFTLKGICWTGADFFWRSAFYPSSSTRSGLLFEDWQKWSHEDPSFIFRQGWMHEVKSVFDLISTYDPPPGFKLKGVKNGNTVHS